MITGNINYPCAFSEQTHNLFYHLHMCLRKISFAELPAINNIAIQNKNPRSNTFQVINYFIGVAAIGTKVQVTHYHNINISMLHSIGVLQKSQDYIMCML